MNKWKKISSAPKDESMILCWDGGMIAICDWHKGYGFSVSHDAEDYAYNGYTPTHWQPLPEPPK